MARPVIRIIEQKEVENLEVQIHYKQFTKEDEVSEIVLEQDGKTVMLQPDKIDELILILNSTKI